MKRRLATAVAALVVALCGWGPAVAAPLADPVVVGDDEADVYRGSGELFLPGHFNGSPKYRKRAANCPDCLWRYTVFCMWSTGDVCGHAVNTCPRGMIRYRVWLQENGGPWVLIGSICWGGRKPVTKSEADQLIRQRAQRALPRLAVAARPTRTITSVPVAVTSGQPVVVQLPAMNLVGLRIAITARAKWRWAWGDGASTWALVPGTLDEAGAVQHRYRKSGKYRIQGRSYWTAEYSISGLGDFVVAGPPLTQDGAVNIDVRPSRLVLTRE